MKNNGIILIGTLIGAVIFEVTSLVCTISFVVAIDDGKDSTYSLILLVAAIALQILLAITTGSGLYAYWFKDEACFSIFSVIPPLLCLGSVLHLAAAILMVVSTATLSKSERGHIAYGGFIASLDFISFELQIFICTTLSCGMYKQYYDED